MHLRYNMSKYRHKGELIMAASSRESEYQKFVKDLRIALEPSLTKRVEVSAGIAGLFSKSSKIEKDFLSPQQKTAMHALVRALKELESSLSRVSAKECVEHIQRTVYPVFLTAYINERSRKNFKSVFGHLATTLMEAISEVSEKYKLDILKKLPGVDVKAQDEVKLKQKSERKESKEVQGKMTDDSLILEALANPLYKTMHREMTTFLLKTAIEEGINKKNKEVFVSCGKAVERLRGVSLWNQLAASCSEFETMAEIEKDPVYIQLKLKLNEKKGRLTESDLEASFDKLIGMKEIVQKINVQSKELRAEEVYQYGRPGGA